MAEKPHAPGTGRTNTGPTGAEQKKADSLRENREGQTKPSVTLQKTTPEHGSSHPARVQGASADKPSAGERDRKAAVEDHAQPGQFGVHGVQTKRDWPCLTLAEVQSVLAHYPSAPSAPSAVRIVWHSMRPFSAAARVLVSPPDAVAEGDNRAHTFSQIAEHDVSLSQPEAAFILKRHHASLRTVAALEEEHAFMQHLAAKDVPVCLPVATRSGHTALAQGEWTYELFPPAPGQDDYRDVMSWKPYHSTAHARAAGQALGRLHLAASDYAAPSRGEGTVPAPQRQGTKTQAENASGKDDFSQGMAVPAGRPLTSSMNALGQSDLLPALRQWVKEQPGLAEQLAPHTWEDDVQAVLTPFHALLRPLLPHIRSCWGHGDWHGSNLFWQKPEETKTEARVSCILDFGMAERTCVPFDLAVAIERSMIDWLDLSRSHGVVAYAQLEAFLQGYHATHPLDAAEWAQLVAFLPLVHVEFAFSEVSYFGTLLQDHASADVAYTDYLLGHARWFAGPEGQALLDWLTRYAADVSPATDAPASSASEHRPHA
ncbi:phosphotransferase enzyme family protein [Acetobacter tropicalis]|uniref:Aminoglycoside phosphotransferase n=1 Tax=Acetobacter tropicalis TaxID=104102 RepID=A0A291PGG4_9PROT|nr:phosphotransferase [Acetobacter tropicalis]ATJ90570.1 aminoglycoside phosphotransferase [Acetobacter tropicalis]